MAAPPDASGAATMDIDDEKSAAKDWKLRKLYGGALEAAVPSRFEDVRCGVWWVWVAVANSLLCVPFPGRNTSMFRQIPDHQEVFADADTDQSIIIELNSHQEDVDDDKALRWVSVLASSTGNERD